MLSLSRLRFVTNPLAREFRNDYSTRMLALSLAIKLLSIKVKECAGYG